MLQARFGAAMGPLCVVMAALLLVLIVGGFIGLRTWTGAALRDGRRAWVDDMSDAIGLLALWRLVNLEHAGRAPRRWPWHPAPFKAGRWSLPNMLLGGVEGKGLLSWRRDALRRR
jgi:hypothetical protein